MGAVPPRWRVHAVHADRQRDGAACDVGADGLTDDGLPIGVQLIGRPVDEATLIRLAAQIETARPWAGRRPELTEQLA